MTQTPTPEQLQAALEARKQLNQPLYPSDKPPYHTIEDLGQWACMNDWEIQFALRFTADYTAEIAKRDRSIDVLRNGLREISNMSIQTEQGLKDERDEGTIYGSLSKEHCLTLLRVMRDKAQAILNGE